MEFRWREIETSGEDSPLFLPIAARVCRCANETPGGVLDPCLGTEVSPGVWNPGDVSDQENPKYISYVR